MTKIFNVVTSEQDVRRNISTYEAEVARNRGLRGRMRQHPAWYAFKDEVGTWHFGPSKFVGYIDMTPDAYLDHAADSLDGKETEPALKAWFDLVDPETDLHAELLAAFTRFAGKHGTGPNKRWRVSIAKARQDAPVRRAATLQDLSQRVVSNPAICGGRPTIKGTRIRVSDVVEMVASGMTIAEIEADYPQLKAEDVSAALQFAARLMDHAVVHAA